MLSGLLSLGIIEEKRMQSLFLFQAIYFCLDLGIAFLRSFFTLVINIPLAVEFHLLKVLRFKNLNLW